MKKNSKSNRKKLFDDRRIVLVASLIIALLSWVVIAGFINPGMVTTIPNVIIDYKRNAEEYRTRGLQIVGDITDVMADVEVTGDGSLIGAFVNTDVAVYLDFSGVTVPGVHEVPLRAVKVTPGNYTITGVSLRNGEHSLRKNPKNTVTLMFEEVESTHLPITVFSDGITAASGYFKDTPILSHTEVVVTGPRSEVNRVSRAMVYITGEEERTESKLYQAQKVILLDTSGNEIDISMISNLTMSPEVIDIEIPILDMVNVDIGVEFIGASPNFDMAWFQSLISLSSDSLEVVGASSAFENLSTPVTIATFDMADITLNWVSDPVSVQLPDALQNKDSLKQITASLNSEGNLVERSFPVTNIEVVNGPPNATIVPINNTVTVSIIGPADQVEALLPENIMIQVDAFGIPANRGGKQTIPGRIVIPGADRVFASGNYPIVCNVVVE